MRLPPILGPVLVLAVLATGCAPRPTAPVAKPAPPSTATTPDALPPGAAGKISAAQVGKLSPVPAFRGVGAGWRLQVQAVGDLGHDVVLQRGGRERHGSAVYRPDAPAAGAIELDGTLDDGAPLRIRILREPCTDAAGRAHAHAVEIAIGAAASLRGCGDLAVY